MDHSLIVKVGEAVENLQCDVHNIGGVDGCVMSDEVPDGPAFEQFHHPKRCFVVSLRAGDLNEMWNF